MLEECGAVRPFEMRIGRERQQCYFVEKKSSGARSPSRKAQSEDHLDIKRDDKLKIDLDSNDEQTLRVRPSIFDPRARL